MYDVPLDKVLKDYQPMINFTVVKYAKKVSNRYSEEDIVSDCHMKLWQAHETYDASLGYTFTQYARKLIEHAMYERFKRARNQKKHGTQFSLTRDDPEWEGESHQWDIPDTSDFGKHDQDNSVNEFFAGLAEDTKDMLVKYFILGEKLGDIGKFHGISRQAVQQRIKKTIKKRSHRIANK